MAYETGQQLYHRVELEGRDKLTVSGVEEVERFDENTVVLSTAQGGLEIQGERTWSGSTRAASSWPPARGP